METLLLYRNSDGSWGGDPDYPNDNLDTALALQALKAANYADQNIYPALSYLLSTQKPDGGWGFTEETESNVSVSALILSTLAQYKSNYDLRAPITFAASFLLTQQNADGGFATSTGSWQGSSPSTVYETAPAFIALIESGQTQLLPLLNAVSFLTASQLADGSWNDDPYSTALAVRALAQVKPDLAITAADIAVSPDCPTVGGSLSVTAMVRNTGLEGAANVTVRLLDNGNLVGEQIIAAIPVGGGGQATFAITLLAPAGEHILTVTVDPANAIDELNEANNSATYRLWAKAPADLVVTPDFLTATPAYPKPGDTVTINFAVANMGESAARSFAAILYAGDPSGIQLGTATIPGIAAGAWGEGSITFTLASAGVHTLYLAVDPQNSVTELSKANNTAQKAITVNAASGTGFIDLAIPMNGIRLDPARPASGATVTVNLSAVNYGTEAATADLELFDGDPAAGGILLYKAPVTLNAGETHNVAAPWQIPAGVRTLHACVDPTNVVAERDETNNSQELAAMADMVDIEVSASDIAIEPEHPMDGDSATVKLTVQNRGIKATGLFTVNLYNGDPASGGALLQSFAVADLPGDGVQEFAYPFTAAHGTYRFYAVCDPDNKVAELYEDNNTAIRALLVKSSAEAKGPDLVPLDFDLSAATTDPQSLRISGTATVKFQNKGDDKVATPFRITVFEDKDGDGVYTEGIDLPLGFWDYSATMNPNIVGVVTINLAGTLTFRDAPIYAMVDSGQSVFEQNETNNSIRRGSACEVRPAMPIEPVLRWKWDATNDPMFGRITSTPVVISLTDDNGDGKIDNNDAPAVLVNAWAGNYQTLEGKLWAFDGKTGAPVMTRYVAGQAPYECGNPIAGDIDGDGKPEILINKYNAGGGLTGMLAFSHDGTFLWDNSPQVRSWFQANPFNIPYGASHDLPMLADLDGDGRTEIIDARTIMNWDGSVRCAPNAYISSGIGWTNGFGYSVTVADLDMDGKQEVIAGNNAFNSDCTIKWYNSSLPDGLTSIGNFDDDPYPEIVLVSSNGPLGARVYLVEHDGKVKWGPVIISRLEGTSSSGLGGHPMIADFDGDGKPEIGVAGINKYFILDQNGRVKTTLSFPNPNGGNSSGVAPAVFDLDGDGRPDVLFSDNNNFMIFDGKDGTLRYKETTGLCSYYPSQNVIIADVDGDGHAEAVVTGNNGYGTMSGNLRVYGAKNNDWVGTRRIWNEPSYHVTNANDDGSIPQYEAPSWLLNNSYRCNVPTSPSTNPYVAADLSASFVRVDMTNYPGSVTITARIGNGGAKAVDPGLKAAFYDGDPANAGLLIGSALTTKTLNPGDYEDVAITWSAPAEGNHTIQVMADPDNTIAECDKGNNAISLPIYVTSGLPDLAIAAEDVVAPATIPEGSLADIAVTVRNLGTMQANSVLVRLFAGNPATGGKQIGADRVIPIIAAGGAATVSSSWNTLGSLGGTWLYTVVDPAGTTPDASRGNNTAIREVLVTPAVKPDLQIAPDDITVAPAAPTEGDTLTVTALVQNRGTQTANAKVALYDGNPAGGGIKRGETLIPQVIPMGGSAPAIFTLDTGGLAGSRVLYARVDPDNAIDESNEANNQTSRTVTIGPAGLTVGIGTGKGAYSANENVQAVVALVELKGQSRTLTYDLQILDGNGVLTATAAADTPLALGANANLAFTAAWNTGTTYSGPYTVNVRMKENGRIIAKASAPFAILPVKTADARITADKLSYGANENVALAATVTSTSPNYAFAGLTTRITLNDSSGKAVFSDAGTIAVLAPGSRSELKSWWNTAGNAKGVYTATVEVRDGTTLLSSGSTTFEISGSAVAGAGLAATVAVQPGVVEAGTGATLSFSVTNRGNEDIASLALTVLIVDLDSGQAVKKLAVPAGGALAINATQTGGISFFTTGLTPKTFLAILQNTTQGTSKSLASTPLTVTDITPPVLTVSALGDGAYTNNATLNVAGSVTDNSGVKELRINGTTVPVNGDGSFSYALFLASGANTITTIATDLGGNRTTDTRTINLDQTAPLLVVTAPADNSKTGKQSVMVSGTVDENAVVQVKIKDVPQTVTMNGTGFTATVALISGLNTIDITATDLAGNTSSQKRTLLYDDGQPSLAITTPVQDIRTNQGSVMIRGTATDALTAVSITVAKESELFIPPVINGTFEQAVTFSDEKSYPLVVTATNEVGTAVSVQRNIIYDITPPRLTINPVTTPTSLNRLTVSGTREDGAAVTVTCATATIGEVAYPSATSWQVAIAGLKEGENVLTTTATDAAGNVATASTSIVGVTQLPDITVTATPNIIWPPNHKMVPVIVGGGIEPHGADIQSVTVTVTDEYGKYNYDNLHFGDTVSLEAWREGKDTDGRLYIVTVIATDRAGNRTVKSTPVVVPHDMAIAPE